MCLKDESELQMFTQHIYPYPFSIAVFPQALGKFINMFVIEVSTYLKHHWLLLHEINPKTSDLFTWLQTY